MKKSSPLIALWCCVAAISARGQSLGPEFVGDYSISSLGSAPGLPANYGGLVFKTDDPDTILIGGAANGGSGAIYALGVIRDSGTNSIVGFTGPAVFYASAPGIDGGLAYMPNGTLVYTAYPSNQIGQVKNGSVSPDKVSDATVLGIAPSVGSLALVPAGFAGAGSLKVASYSASRVYDVAYSPDGTGTYDFATATETTQITGGVEGMVYIKGGSGGNAGFSADSMLVAEYIAGKIGAYELDSAGNPIASTRRDFITGLGGAEGAAIDPLTGDFLFSTFGGGNQIVKVTGFLVPEPGQAALLFSGILVFIARRRRRKV